MCVFSNNNIKEVISLSGGWHGKVLREGSYEGSEKRKRWRKKREDDVFLFELKHLN